MLSDYTPVATLATSDLSRARTFYEDTLGLSIEREGGEGVAYACGGGSLFVYLSAYAGTNQATAVTFSVPASAFDGEVSSLREKRVELMTFEMEGIDWDDGVASMGPEMRGIWFADPDGNILNLAASA